MALEHAKPGEVITLANFAEQAREGSSNALVKADTFEAILMHILPEKPLPPHKVDVPIIVQCLAGSLNFSVDGDPRKMAAGDWLYLDACTMHAVDALDPAFLLVTILFGDTKDHAKGHSGQVK